MTTLDTFHCTSLTAPWLGTGDKTSLVPSRSFVPSTDRLASSPGFPAFLLPGNEATDHVQYSRFQLCLNICMLRILFHNEIHHYLALIFR